MRPPYLKKLFLRAAIGVLLAVVAGTLQKLLVREWPDLHRPIDLVMAFLLAIALYLLVFSPILALANRDKASRSDVN